MNLTYLTAIQTDVTGHQFPRPYQRHQLAWGALQQPEKANRDFLFHFCKSPIGYTIYYTSPNCLIEGLSQPIPCPKLGATIHFQILCKPCKKHQGKEIPLRDPQLAKDWLLTKLEPILKITEFQGFLQTPEIDRKPNGLRIVLHRMEAQGSGTLIDPAALMHITSAGIGGGKSFGYGLLLWKAINLT